MVASLGGTGCHAAKKRPPHLSQMWGPIEHRLELCGERMECELQFMAVTDPCVYYSASNCLPFLKKKYPRSFLKNMSMTLLRYDKATIISYKIAKLRGSHDIEADGKKPTLTFAH